MASSSDWRQQLVEAHPDLFHPPADDPRAAEGSPECGEGWRDLLERAFARIRAAVQADGGGVVRVHHRPGHALGGDPAGQQVAHLDLVGIGEVEGREELLQLVPSGS